MIAAHKSSKEIGEELGLNSRTVDNRRTAICEKLGLHGSNALMRFAMDHRNEIIEL